MKFVPETQRPVVYLSGSFGALPKGLSEADWMKLTGCNYRCYSFAYVCPGAFYYNKRMQNSLEECIAAGCGIMMDSSAFSFHMAVKKAFGELSHKKLRGRFNFSDIDGMREQVISQYIDYVKANSKKWDFYVTFDYVKRCPIIYQMTKKLEAAGIRPIPVYHGDAPLDWLERYCKEGYKFIGIGSVSRPKWKDKNYYYNQVHNITEKYGVKTHGLAVTSLSHMFRFPWYSVDSATWVKTAAYGKIIYLDQYRNIIGQLHVSDKESGMSGSYNTLPKSVQTQVREQIEGYGFDFEKVRASQYYRCAYNAHLFAKHIQELKEVVAEGKVSWKQLI